MAVFTANLQTVEGRHQAGVAQALPALRHTQILSSASSTWRSQHPLAKKMAKTVGLEVRRQDVCSSQSPAPGKQGT